MEFTFPFVFPLLVLVLKKVTLKWPLFSEDKSIPCSATSPHRGRAFWTWALSAREQSHSLDGST